jgi:hypothetical protein
LLAVDGAAITGGDDLVRLLDAEKIDRAVPIDVLRRSDRRPFWAALREKIIFTAQPRRRSRIPAKPSRYCAGNPRPRTTT